MDRKIFILPATVYDIVEQDFKTLLAPAVERAQGREDVDTVWEHVKTGSHQAWMIFETPKKPLGAMVTHIAEYPLRDMLSIDWLAGENMDDWIEDLLTNLERFAKETRCVGLEIIGRPGWAKYLAKYGWTAPHVVCEKFFGDPVTAAQDAA